MSKKSMQTKMILGKRLKRSRRIPVLAIVRTHRRIEYNKFRREWRRNKMRIKA